jgi:DNA-binding transcriptional MerR regulator
MSPGGVPSRTSEERVGARPGTPGTSGTPGTPGTSGSPDTSDTRPLYAISVAGELTGLAVPTLRLYEQHGLVAPVRTEGGTRRYSAADLQRARRVSALVEAGVTLGAVGRVIDLEDANDQLTTHNRRLRARNSELRRDNERLRTGGAGMDEVSSVPDDVPVEDVAEQRIEVTAPEVLDDADEAGVRDVVPTALDAEADEGDLLEQRTPVAGADDDYPPDVDAGPGEG